MTALPPPRDMLASRLGVEVGDLSSAELARLDAALDDATSLALALVTPAVATAWETSAPRVVVTVVLKAARREFVNPDGETQSTVPDLTTATANVSGAYLTDGEQRTIRTAAGAGAVPEYRGWVGEIRTPVPYEDAGLYVDPYGVIWP